jgi:hypothetical protein
VGYCGSLLGAAAVTGFFIPVRENVNSTTVALAFLLVVLVVAFFGEASPRFSHQS